MLHPVVKCGSALSSLGARSMMMVKEVSSLARTCLWGKVLMIHSPPALFLFFFFSRSGVSSRSPVPLLGQDESTVAKRAETTVAECSLAGCAWARFPDSSHCMPRQHSQPDPTSLVKNVCVFRCNLPPALLEEWPTSFTCHCGNTGVDRTPNTSQHIMLNLEKKIFPSPLPGFELATFRSRVRRSTRELAIPAPGSMSIDSSKRWT